MKAVGIGCFWFADARGEPENYDDFSPKEHMESVQTALEGVDSISNLKISKRSDDYIVSGQSFFDDPQDDKNYFPLIDHVTINFDIFMPDRLQQKYGLGRFYDKGRENFHVKIVFDGGLPVTYIYYDIESPSEKFGFMTRCLQRVA